jgi:hypothetical protein
MPTVEFPVAAPKILVQLAAVAEALTLPAYVYLLRVVVLLPNVKIPATEFPAADPALEVADEDVAEAFTQPEYVYLFRVVDGVQDTEPKANIAKFPV